MRLSIITIWIILLFQSIATAFAQDKPQLVIQKAHTGAINSIFFSADDKLIYTQSDEEHSLKIWSARDGMLVKEFKSAQSISIADVPSHGSSIVSTSGFLKLLKPDGSLINEIPKLKDEVFEADKKTGNGILYNYKTGLLRLVNTTNGKVEKEIKRQENNNIKFVLNQSGFVTITHNNTVAIYNLQTFELVDSALKVKSGFYSVPVVTVSNDASLTAIVAANNVAIVNTRLKDTLVNKTGITASGGCFSPDAERFIAYSGDSLFVINVKSAIVSKHFMPFKTTPQNISFLNDEVIRINCIGKFYLYNLKTQNWIFASRFAYNPNHYEATNDRFFYCRNDSLFCMSLTTGKTINSIKLNLTRFSSILSIRLNHKGDQLAATGFTDNSHTSKVWLFNPNSLHYIRQFPRDEQAYKNINYLSFVNNDSLIISGVNSGTKLFTTKAGRVISLNQYGEVIGGTIKHFVIAEDSVGNGTSEYKKRLVLMDIATGKVILRSKNVFLFPVDLLSATIIAKKNRIVFTTSTGIGEWDLNTNTIEEISSEYLNDGLWEQAQGYLLYKSPAGQTNRVYSISSKLKDQKPWILKEGDYSVFEGTDKMIGIIGNMETLVTNLALYDLKQRKVVAEKTINQFNTNIYSMAFSPLQNTVAIGCLHGLLVYRVNNTWQTVIADTANALKVLCTSLSTDGKNLFYGTENKQIIRMDLVSLKTDTLPVDLAGMPERIVFNEALNTLAIVQDANFITFFDLKQRKVNKTLVNLKEKGWQVILPDNYYYLSGKLPDNITYTIWPNSYPVNQFDIKYNRPDKVLQATGCTDTALVHAFKKAYEKRIKKLGIDTLAFRSDYDVPKADFVNRDSITFDQHSEKLMLHVKGNDPKYKLERFNIWINDVPLFGMSGISLKNHYKSSLDTTITITLGADTNRIETSVTNTNGMESYRMPLTVNYIPPQPVKQKVYFAGIGINRFTQSQNNLQWSVKDIRDLSLAMKLKYGNDIVIDTLFDEQVTVEQIKKLKSKLLKTAVNDKIIIAYSGHGLLSSSYDYYLSTYNINFKKPEENGLTYEEFENLTDGIPARKKLVLIDACHSGEVDKEEMARYTRLNHHRLTIQKLRV